MTDPAPRFVRLTPDRFIVCLLVVECLLWLSERLGWWHKGYAVLTTVAVVGVAMVLLTLWFGVALSFRRRFQFSIRSLLVLVVVIAVSCSWMAAAMKKAREQNEALKEISKLGGGVEFDYRFEGDYWIFDAITWPPEPAWLRKTFGGGLFDRVYLATLPDDTSLTVLDRLPDLWYLILSDCSVTDAGLATLGRLPKLRRLYLYNTRISDAGLIHLTKLTSLQELLLIGTNVTEDGVKKLQKALPNCLIRTDETTSSARLQRIRFGRRAFPQADDLQELQGIEGK
jgi:hypothetical protein